MNKTVLYESWQMECCGDLFKVGDTVSWHVTAFKKAYESDSTLDTLNIDYCEDHHLDEDSRLPVLHGTVETITLLYERYEAEGRILVPVTSKLVAADEAARSYEDIDNFQFSAFIVKLSNTQIADPIQEPPQKK